QSAARLPPVNGTGKRNPFLGTAAALRAHGLSLALPEAGLVEGLALAPQVVDRPRQTRRQDRQHATFAALFQLPPLPLLGPLTAAQEQAGGLAEGPAQVGVADLLPAPAEHLAGRLVPRTHQACIRQELPLGAEAADVVNLVEQHQGEDLA